MNDSEYDLVVYLHFRNGEKVKHIFRGDYRNSGQSWFKRIFSEWQRDGLIPISSQVKDGYMPYHALDKITFE